MKHILVVILAIFVDISLPQSNKTNQDTEIYNAHLEIYHKLHRQLTLMQIIAQGSTKEIASNFPLQTNASLSKLEANQAKLKVNLNDQVQSVLTGISLSTDVYKIENCINDSNARFDELVLESKRYFNDCINKYTLEVQRVSGILNDLFAKQSIEYRKLENVFRFCYQISKSSQFLHQCLYNQFYVDHTIAINQLKVKTREVIEEYFSAFESGGDNLDKCTNGLIPKQNEKLYQLVDVFKICLQID